MSASIFICYNNGEDMQNVHATELQSFYLQLAQTPLTTILMFSSLKSAGNIMVGIAISF